VLRPSVDLKIAPTSAGPHPDLPYRLSGHFGDQVDFKENVSVTVDPAGTAEMTG